MEWSKVSGLLAVICFLGTIGQLLRLRIEVKKVDKNQELTRELAKKWNKRLNWIIIFGGLGAIFSVLAEILKGSADF
ncbi:hypothetical protein [Neobacillus cucumis]|uniref:hypothetical protein n=1 Tax=Neobacillus cucumis TaxID=1740721 RepID=UPI0019658333|nr:hypothetical protein [Neobacillus cucumis]MBM7651096.1 putative membrane protein [Neobacillus cucumis]